MLLIKIKVIVPALVYTRLGQIWITHNEYTRLGQIWITHNEHHIQLNQFLNNRGYKVITIMKYTNKLRIALTSITVNKLKYIVQ